MILRTRPDRHWGQPSLLYNECRVAFPRVKRPERGVNCPLPSSAEVEETVEVYLYFPSWPDLGRPLPLPYFPIGRAREVWERYNKVPLTCLVLLPFFRSSTISFVCVFLFVLNG